MKNRTLTGAIFLGCTTFVGANSTLETTNQTKEFLSKAIDLLSQKEQEKFVLGKSFFSIPWVEAPSATTARDGLGPLFSANACISCHPHNGAGSVFTLDGTISRSLVTRFAKKNQKDFHNGFIGDSVYGAQLSINGVKDVPFEGKPTLQYKKIIEKYPDGTKVILKKPILGVKDLHYGKLEEDTTISNRLAQPLVGMGWIGKIEEQDILKNVDTNDSNGDGIKGKANWVFDKFNNKISLGRFTWKASVATLKEQSAEAFINDMGLTTTIYPKKNCTTYQKECLDAPKGRDAIDVPDERLEAVSFYLSNLKVPKPTKTKEFIEGEKLFETIGCTKCHIPSFEANQRTIFPYSDFLLHDMGKDLSDDGRGEFEALPNEWRTQPLWGIGKRGAVLGQSNYLHDGRATTIEEAILWHGGEAKGIKERFKALDKKQREKILRFLRGL